MSIQRVRAMKKRQAADLKKRQARSKAAKAKREKAKADKAKADKAKAKKAPAPKKKVATKKAAVKRREPTKVATKKAAVKRRAPVKDKGQRGAPTKVPEEYGGKQAPITKGQTTPSKESQSTEDLLRQYNESQGAKDHGLSVTFDEETGEYVEDVSAFGFEGDQATKRYSPEEFQKKMGGGSEAAVEEAVEETAQEIKQNSPKFFSSEYKLTTKADYKSFIKRNYKNLIYDVTVYNNSDYTNRYLKYLNDELGLTDYTDSTNALFNQYNYADSADVNNIYLTIVPSLRKNKSVVTRSNYLSPAVKEKIQTEIEDYKLLNSEIAFIDPVYLKLDASIRYTGEPSRVSYKDTTQIELIKSNIVKLS